MFHTDAERTRFLLEAEAELGLWLGDERLDTVAKAADEDRPRYVTNYIGSKQKLIDWIWDATPDGAKTAVDAFSGSSVVGYMYKSHGLGVHACDRLAYCHHIARAIVENDGVMLSDAEIDALLADNPKASDFVRKTFAGFYFEPGVHAVIDTIRSNVDANKLAGFKKDIALFALGKGVSAGQLGYATRIGDGQYSNLRYNETLDALDVELLDDVVILKKETAEQHLVPPDPPALASLTIEPVSAAVKPNENVAFRVRGTDQYGKPFPVPSVRWTCAKGTIDDQGLYTAPEYECESQVNAAAGTAIGSARATVKDRTTPPPPKVRGIRWTGEVPAPKWMKFYTAVLARFATRQGLSLQVEVTMAPADGVQDSDVEATKIALRELGLSEDVEWIAVPRDGK